MAVALAEIATEEPLADGDDDKDFVDIQGILSILNLHTIYGKTLCRHERPVRTFDQSCTRGHEERSVFCKCFSREISSQKLEFAAQSSGAPTGVVCTVSGTQTHLS